MALADDLVEEPDALHALVDVLGVEVGEEVGDGGEHHAGVFTTLGVQLLKAKLNSTKLNNNPTCRELY